MEKLPLVGVKLAGAILVAVTAAVGARFSVRGAVQQRQPTRSIGVEPRQASLPLLSALKRPDAAFASNAAGLFRAKLPGHVWKRLSVPASMPLGGRFANQPANSPTIFYYTTKPIDPNVPPRARQVEGLYVSRDSGQTWSLASQGRYWMAFVHPDGDLFVVAAPRRLLQSKDGGQSWREIPHKFGQIINIFADPDHPGLVCVTDSGIRRYVNQAQDESYQWTQTMESNWWPSHGTAERFLARDASLTSYSLQATLGNYFAHDFGSQIELPAMDAVPARSSYIFARGQAMPVTFSIPFLYEPPAVRGNMAGASQPAPSVALKVEKDERQAPEVWGLKVIAPGGKPTYVLSSVSRQVSQAGNQRKVERELRESGHFKTVEVKRGKPYRRVIDLAQLYNFSAPGIYRVQLLYDAMWLQAEEPGERAYSFSGQAFTVSIT